MRLIYLNNYFIARTGVYSKYPGSDAKHFFGGFSCKNDPEEAKKVSVFEVAERILATYYFSIPEMRDDYYPLQSIFDGSALGVVKADDVLIGSVPHNKNNYTDAVGLGFHLDKQKAINHAVCELLERHVLGKIWYENNQIVELLQDSCGEFIYTAFTIQTNEILPFAMSVMRNKACNILCVGASFEGSMQEAINKSKCEVIMLIHDVLAKKSNAHMENVSSKKRMLSQSDPEISLLRQHYLSSITHKKNIDLRYDVQLNLKKTLATLNAPHNEIGYCALHESAHGHLIRAVSMGLISLREYRNQYRGTDKYILDPVC